MQTVNSQSLLAKLLASENISVQHTPGIKTAMFDLKNRVLMLPVWNNVSQDLEHLLLGHETGHAIDTPCAEEYKAAYEGITNRIFGKSATSTLTKTVAGFLNVIEDARIDKRQKRRFPGLRKNYLAGYKELIDRNFFGTQGRDINSMSFIDRANLYFKGGHLHFKIDFTPQERAFIKRIENAEKFEEVVSLTEEVYLFCKNKIETAKTDLDFSKADSDFDEEEYDYNVDSGDNDDWDDSDESDDSESSDDTSTGEGKDEDEDDDDADEDKEVTSNNNSQRSAGRNSEHSDNDQVPKSETDQAWQQKNEELVMNVNRNYVYAQLPDVDYKKAIHPYKKVLAEWRSSVRGDHFKSYQTPFMKWRQKEKDSISFMVKEFEQRKSAEIYSRISIAKTGTIDTNKLHSYRYNDDIFRRLSVIPEGKNHGFVMFLDWSGSMDYGLKYTIRQLLTLVLFCKQIQVPFEVYAFKDTDGNDPFVYVGKDNVLKCNNITLRQFLSSSMSTSELNDAMTYLWAMGNGMRIYCEARGGTPLNDAIIIAPKIVNDFRKKFKLEIVNTIFLTDGDSNGFYGIENPTYDKYHSANKKTTHFLTDKQSGKSYEFNHFGAGSAARNNTTILLQMLKNQTGCNLIGFFLFSESWYSFLSRFGFAWANNDYQNKMHKFWKENKFYPVKSAGYDDYYVIDAKALRNNEEDKLEIDTSKSTKQMAKQFAKFTSAKTINRVLLRNFIDNVTGHGHGLGMSDKKKIA